MKIIFKYIGISVAALLIIIIVAAVSLPYILPLDKIKDMATAKMSETIHRDIRLGKVSFNIFTGVKLTNLYIGNRKGFPDIPFVSAKAIGFRYNFWKLIQGKIEITKAVLVNPEILIEIKADGTTNYGDLLGAPKAKTEKKVTKEEKKKEALSLLVSRFAISNGKLTMVTHGPDGKKVNQLRDLQLDISNISFKTTEPISISLGVMGIYEEKYVPIRIAGKLDLDLDNAYVNIRSLLMSAAGEELKISGKIRNFNTAPDINIALSTGGLNIDKFMNILTGTKQKMEKKEKPPYGQLTRTANKALKSIPERLKVEAQIDLKNITFREMKMDSLKINVAINRKIVNIGINEIKAYKGILTGSAVADLNMSGIQYSVKNLSIKGFNAAPAANDAIGSFLTGMKDYKDLENKIEGSLDVNVSLNGSGVEVPDIIANAKANGNFILTNGRIRKLKSLEGIADKLNIETLKHDIELKEFKADFSVANKVATISDLILHNGEAGDAKITFNGKANIETMAFIKGNVLALKLHPHLTRDLPKEYESFKDKEGWAILEFELTGSLKKPIPMPKLDKPIQNIIEQKKEEAKKSAEDQLKKQLEDKAKELIKF